MSAGVRLEVPGDGAFDSWWRTSRQQGFATASCRWRRMPTWRLSPSIRPIRASGRRTLLRHAKKMDPVTSSHHAAALVIERRGLGQRARRGERCECAGINRHGEGDERALRRRGSDPRWPRVMRRRPQGRRRSVGRGTCRPGYRAAKSPGPGCRRPSHKRKATPPVAPHRKLPADPAWSENLRMHGISMCENREVPCLPGWLITSRAAQARPRPQS